MTRYQVTLTSPGIVPLVWVGDAESRDDAEERATVVWQRQISELPTSGYSLTTRPA
jgi:hypothetical protein